MENRLPTWEIWLASFIGGSFLCIADILFNDLPVTTRISAYLQTHLGDWFNSSVFELVAFLLLIVLGVGLCFVNQPKSRRGAFAQGSSVIGVLFGMNLGSSAISFAAAQTITLEGGTADISVQKPRAYGPLGVGTLLTGRSFSVQETVIVDEAVTVECATTITVGKDSYCSVSYGDIAPNLAQGGLLEADLDQPIWLRGSAG